MYLFYKIKN